ncbi:MAG: YggS family pyridoxal phosphate-dependent enzyme [Bacteroidota bacterium]|nr:YggS family pyridoxal phosphate-dependent enzyme [Bacteroidota bacterium]
MKQLILNNLDLINQRIKKACENCGRNPQEVKLLLATKTVAPDIIKIALENGSTLIGENKVQEVKLKYDELKAIPHQNHFIGHLQTNKIKDLLKCNISCIQSVDRMDLAEKIQSKLEQENKTLDILIQVNTSGEISKYGVAPTEAIDLIKKISKLDRLNIKGLMTIGALSDNQLVVRNCFRLLMNIKKEVEQLQLPSVEMKELSMGMSSDLELAIAEGATIIRVGSAVFGNRVYN